MQRVVGVYRKVETPVNVLASVLALYLAGGNVLRAAKWPHESTWSPWTAWFIALLVAALFVPLFALLKYFDARDEKHDKEQSVLDSDMARLCQEVAAALAYVYTGLSLDKVAVQIWLCDETSGAFDRRWRFFLPFDRISSGIRWRKGVGVAGMAWESGRNLAVPLAALKVLSQDEFDALTPEQQIGMTYEQIQASAYSGIIAMRLLDDGVLLGMLVIDYTGDDGFEQLRNAMDDVMVSKVVGTCARRLTSATFLRSSHGR